MTCGRKEAGSEESQADFELGELTPIINPRTLLPPFMVFQASRTEHSQCEVRQ